MNRIRTASRAFIQKEGKILLIKYVTEERVWYVLPGGGQKKNTTLEESLKRECLEETGYHIAVGPLILVREYISNHHEFKHSNPDFHQIDFIFQCEIIGEHEDGPQGVDLNQVGIEWIHSGDLNTIPLYPKILLHIITKTGIEKGHSVYLGDVN